MSSLGKKLEELRKNAGITQEELAAALNVTRQAVSRWELDLAVPKSDALKALCEFFNVKPEYFLFDNAEIQPLVSSEAEIAVAAAGNAERKKKSRKQIVTIISVISISIIFIVCAVLSFSWFFILSNCAEAAVSGEDGAYCAVNSEYVRVVAYSTVAEYEI